MLFLRLAFDMGRSSGLVDAAMVSGPQCVLALSYSGITQNLAAS